MMDANQVWDVDEAIAAIQRLAQFDPWWMEEPTSPDDVLGHARIAREVAPVRIATGEHCQNRVMFKQLMQAGGHAGSASSTRAAWVASTRSWRYCCSQRSSRVPVCPHAGGVGLSEYVQHVALIDHIAIGGPADERVIEFVDELHEHFVAPARDLRWPLPRPGGPGLQHRDAR